VRMLLDSANVMQILINDLMEATKIETNQVRFQYVSFNLRELVARVTAIFQKPCDEKNLTLEAEIEDDIPQDLIGDPIRLQQIIVNLVSNSVKFTTQGSIKILVLGNLYDIDYWHLQISVEDTGRGMSPQIQDKIFQEFFSTTDSLQQGGTGLGLSVCKNLIIRMGGSVHFKSELNKGTAFWFRISLKTAISETLKYSPQSYKQMKKILVVDDSLFNAKVMCHYLQQFGCVADIAGDGTEAVCMAEQESYGIIFMDIQMLIKNGIEATKEIHSKGINIPIIANSAGATELEIQAYKEAGMDDYLNKPASKKDVANILLKYSIIKEVIAKNT